MFRIFWPGQSVPRWLVQSNPLDGHEYHSKIGSIEFMNLTVVINWRRRYHVIPVIPIRSTIMIRNCEFIEFTWQRPNSEETEQTVVYGSPYGFLKRIFRGE